MHELWFKRRKHRQFAGIALVLTLTVLGTPSEVSWAAGAGIVMMGMLVRLWASGVVVKNEVLATTGPYAFVRHPLYVGNFLIGVGFCVASGAWWSWAACAALFLFFYPHTIRYEDQKLQRLFGEEWVRWSRTTRALMPRILRFPPSSAAPLVSCPEAKAQSRTAWSLRLSLARNGEPVHVAVGVFCLWYIHTRIL